MPRIALLQGTNAMRRCPMVLASVSSVRSASAARVATPRKSGQQMRPPLTKGVNPGYSYDPASLCSEGASHAVDWMATFPWTGWQKSSGLDGNIPVDYVATFPWTGWQKSVEYAVSPVWLTYTVLSEVVRGRDHPRLCAPASGLPNHFVCLKEEDWRNRETEGLRGLEVDDELEPHWL
jgi:hypothetical protein